LNCDFDLSIIIVNYNAGDLLSRCIDSIYRYVKKHTFEVIVFDNNSSDRSIESVEMLNYDVRILKNNENIGFTKGNNKAYSFSRGKNILFLNPDTEIVDSSIDDLLFILGSDNSIGVSAPKLIYPDGSLQYSCRNFPLVKYVLYDALFLSKFFARSRYFGRYRLSHWGHDRDIDVDWVSGACMMTRRSVIEKVGLFDERFFMYCEEVDLCKRISNSGLRIHYLSSAKVIHYEGQSSKLVKQRSVLNSKVSLLKYFEKHAGMKHVVAVFAIEEIGLFLRALLSLLSSFSNFKVYSFTFFFLILYFFGNSDDCLE